MSKPFSSVPADAELAGWGTGVGAFLLDPAGVNLLAACVGGRVTGTGRGPLSQDWWILAPMTIYALWLAVQVHTSRSWTLRAAVLAFAAWGVLLLGEIVRGRSVGPVVFDGLRATMGAGLLFAAWPYTGRVARTVTVVLFIIVLGLTLELRRYWR